MEWIADPEIWIALGTLTALELVLGIDNIVFISIVAGKLPPEKQDQARRVGLFLAMGMRIALLLCIQWILGLTKPLFEVFGNEISGRDIILVLGGLFLLAHSTKEIHHKLEGADESGTAVRAATTFRAAIVQIVMLDAVFSLDSVITAVGMAEQVGVMIAAIMIAVGCMMIFAKPLGEFVDRHPTVKMLALSFLLLIGTALIADGLDFHIPKGYIYSAMGFSVLVEMLNLKMAKGKPVELHEDFVEAHDDKTIPTSNEGAAS